MIKLYSSNRLPWDTKLESTIDVGQTHFNLVNLSFIFRYYANVDEIRIT